PGLRRVLRVYGDAESEAWAGELPVGEIVGAEEDAIVMLAPEVLRLAPALYNAVRILDGGVFAPVRRHVFGEQALGAAGPACARILAPPHAAAGNGDHDAAGI